eukprot:363413-Chlamydomonas_euryale.AAC.6
MTWTCRLCITCPLRVTSDKAPAFNQVGSRAHLAHVDGAGGWLEGLTHRAGAWGWCVGLVHGVGAWGWRMGLAHGAGAWGWCMGLAHGAGTWGWCMGLVHGAGAWGWCMGLAHGAGTWGWCMGLEHVRGDVLARVGSLLAALYTLLPPPTQKVRACAPSSPPPCRHAPPETQTAQTVTPNPPKHSGHARGRASTLHTHHSGVTRWSVCHAASFAMSSARCALCAAADMLSERPLADVRLLADVRPKRPLAASSQPPPPQRTAAVGRLLCLCRRAAATEAVAPPASFADGARGLGGSPPRAAGPAQTVAPQRPLPASRAAVPRSTASCSARRGFRGLRREAAAPPGGRSGRGSPAPAPAAARANAADCAAPTAASVRIAIAAATACRKCGTGAPPPLPPPRCGGHEPSNKHAPSCRTHAAVAFPVTFPQDAIGGTMGGAAPGSPAPGSCSGCAGGAPSALHTAGGGSAPLWLRTNGGGGKTGAPHISGGVSRTRNDGAAATSAQRAATTDLLRKDCFDGEAPLLEHLPLPARCCSCGGGGGGKADERTSKGPSAMPAPMACRTWACNRCVGASPSGAAPAACAAAGSVGTSHPTAGSAGAPRITAGSVGAALAATSSAVAALATAASVVAAP